MNTQNPAKVSTCLWFDGKGEEAAAFYTSLLPNSAITGELRPDPTGPALVVEFTLAGVPYQILNGGPHFTPSEAASIVVITDSIEETDYLWTTLTADGGSESQCGWLKDRFGVSWQIVPRRFLELSKSENRDAAARMTQAMMQMRKLDIVALEAAFTGAGSHA